MMNYGLHPLDIHLLSPNGPFPKCWEEADKDALTAALDDETATVRATQNRALVTCPACRKGLFDA